MTVTIERPEAAQVAGYWIPIEEPGAVEGCEGHAPHIAPPAQPHMIDWQAKEIGPGVFLSNRHVVDGVDELRAPLKVVSVEEGVDCTGDPILWFTVDNGWRLPFEHDFVCEVQCMPLPCPPWCVHHSFDRVDGFVRHGGAEEIVLFRDEKDKEHEVYVVLSRHDDPDGTISEETAVSIVLDGTGFDVTPLVASEVGRIIARLGAAGATGPNFVEVEDIRLGDSVETPAGWQTVTSLMHDGLCAEVAIYTTSDEDAAMRVPLGTPINHIRNARSSS